jgi:hypothetical protein
MGAKHYNNQRMFSKVRMAATTLLPRYGFGMNSALTGIASGLTLPVVMMMMLIGGHCP